MRDVGDFQAVGENKTKRVMAAAFLVALVLHVLVLLVRLDFSSPVSRSYPTISLALEEDPPLVIKETQSVPITEVEPLSVKDRKEHSPVEVYQAEMVITTDGVEENIRKAPSLNSDEFRRFIQSEVQNFTNSSPNAVREFSETFTAPIKPEFKDIEPDTDPLSGGAYDVRKNGVECQTLKMTKQSFDELNGAPTISTIGACKDLKKKIDLLDKDGKIRNSDRNDW